ncbi:hypothetical protein PVAP13_4KG121705 [Panicum virgatum]|uniref:Transcription factor CBF/NF-Y/archaeal histone domain-containing protein n=1 Tax=Panicum virgatum TaxID=38727 RepID=A0A8T0TMA1_PANVG|nr:hypothetical protein PVAP13_4KG121705 [Panicum virgatum]
MDKNQANNLREGARGTDHAPEEHRIPRATVARIMRHGSPPNSTITGDAKEAVDNCLVEFCAVLIAAAVEECRQEQAHDRDRRRPNPRLGQPRIRGLRQAPGSVPPPLPRDRGQQATRPAQLHGSGAGPDGPGRGGGAAAAVAGANPAAGAAAVGA